MGKIIGSTTMTPIKRSDWLQNDETKANYILNKPEYLSEDSISSVYVVHGDTKINLADIIDNYILSVDYSSLAFDTTEIVVGSTTNTTSVLGQAILGQLVLA